MSSVYIENGKRIEELLEISLISSDDTYFPLSSNAMTRKISITNLRNAFSADTATTNLNNLFYTAEKMNLLLGNLREEISRNSTAIDNLSKRIDGITNNFGSELSAFKRETANNFADVRESIRVLRRDMEAADAQIRRDFEAADAALDARLRVVEAKLANITGILVGTSVPGTLPSGTIYIQYF